MHGVIEQSRYSLYHAYIHGVMPVAGRSLERFGDGGTMDYRNVGPFAKLQDYTQIVFPCQEQKMVAVHSCRFTVHG